LAGQISAKTLAMSELIAPIREEDTSKLLHEIDTIQSMINRLDQNAKVLESKQETSAHNAKGEKSRSRSRSKS
jgi:hypothetical protein